MWSKVRLPSHVGRLDDLIEQPRVPVRPEVGLVEPLMPNRTEVGSEEPAISNGPGGGCVVFGAGVACSWLVVSH